MKPVAFDYARPRGILEATELLCAHPGAKILAGGQTLGPMLNLRLVQPELLIDITRIKELVEVREGDDSLTVGACVTHAAIEDGRARDPANGYLRRVATGIAYRAVRTRGTIGGSLSHGDPAADWICALLPLGSELEIAHVRGTRRAALDGFVKGAMETDLGAGELVTAIRVPKSGKTVRHGYHKICRKRGEFAEAIGAVALDPASGLFRMVAGGGSQQPVLFDDPTLLFKTGDPFDADSFDMHMAMDALRGAGMELDDYEVRIRAVAMGRALVEAMSL